MEIFGIKNTTLFLSLQSIYSDQIIFKVSIYTFSHTLIHSKLYNILKSQNKYMYVIFVDGIKLKCFVNIF